MRVNTWLERFQYRKALGEFSDLSGWRNYYFDLILLLSLLLLPLALAVTLPSYIAERHYDIIAFEIGIVLFLVLIFFIHKPIPRGIFFFVFFIGMILTFFISLGPFYARPGWLVLSAVTAAMLFGASAAMAIIGINAALLAVLYLFIGPHLPSWAPVYEEPLHIWIIFMVNISLISLVASLPASLLLGRLSISFRHERDLMKNLASEREALQETADSLMKEMEERKQVEKALRESEQKARAIFDSSFGFIGHLSPDGTIIEVNRTALDFAGIQLSDVAGKPCWETPWCSHSPELAGLLKAGVQKAAGGETVRFEATHPASDGTIHTIDFTLKPVMDESGQVTMLIPEGRDITERKRAEEALLESQQRLSEIIDFLPDATFAIDRDGKVMAWNRAIEEMTGVDSESVLGKGNYEHAVHFYGIRRPMVLDLVFQPDEEIRDRYHYIMKEGDILTAEADVPIKGGSPRILSGKARPLYDSKGTIVGAIQSFRDVTEQRQAEREKRRLEDQLVQAQKMESIGTLAGGIAHDFNNILSVIMGYSELVFEDGSDPEKVKSEIREVIKAAERAKDLVRHILTFSRRTETASSPLELSPLIRESLKMLRSVIPSTIEIRQELSESGLVMSDPTQVHQIMMNLCTNASHAMDQTGGVLSVRLHNLELDGTAAHELDLRPGPYARLSVSDTGSGITPEVLGRIFEPYFTTKELGRGTGLGLSVVHGIVRSQQGAIVCTSTHGEGTTFDVYLPVTEPMAQDKECNQGEAPPTGTGRILFVDDEPTLVDLAERMIVRLGYDVVGRTSSLDALDSFKAQPDVFDLVITDMTMPGMTGHMLAQKLMEIRPDIPIILCTGYSENISAESAKGAGIREYVMKPLKKKELAETISRILAGR